MYERHVQCLRYRAGGRQRDARPVATLSAPGSVDVGNVKVGTTSSGTAVQVTNTGNAALSVGASGHRQHDRRRVRGASNGCSNPVAAGNSCTITVSVSPTVTGPLSGALSISSNDPASPTAVSLTGTGTVPQASVDAWVGFATSRNVPQTLPVTLKNTGTAELDVAQVSLVGDGTFSNVGGNCGGALAPGGSCSAQIKFLPTTSGTSNATLTFTDDDGSVPGSNQQVSLQGTVLLPGIQATPTSASFPNVALGRISSVTQVMIKNTGAADLTISSLRRGGNAPKSFVLGRQTCTGSAIAPGRYLQGQRAVRSDQAGR